MSGGHFNYGQFRIEEIADSIHNYIYGREISDEYIFTYLCDKWLSDDAKEYIKHHHRTLPNEYGYSAETIDEMKRGLEIIKKAYIYAQRIDWLLSGDDGEESFHERLKEELDDIDKSI